VQSEKPGCSTRDDLYATNGATTSVDSTTAIQNTNAHAFTSRAPRKQDDEGRDGDGHHDDDDAPTEVIVFTELGRGATRWVLQAEQRSGRLLAHAVPFGQWGTRGASSSRGRQTHGHGDRDRSWSVR
jgi:hypothetical protein